MYGKVTFIVNLLSYDMMNYLYMCHGVSLIDEVICAVKPTMHYMANKAMITNN